MGFIRAKVRLLPEADGAEALDVEALVDTGATLSLFPRRVLESLGVRPTGRGAFRTIEGRSIERDVGPVQMEIQGHRGLGPIPVIFGEEGDTTVVGVTALEVMGLEVDPVRGEQRPNEFLLLSADAGRIVHPEEVV